MPPLDPTARSARDAHRRPGRRGIADRPRAPADRLVTATRGRAAAIALAQASLLLSAAFLLSRVLGYVRVAVLADRFGIGPELDAFYAAFRLPDLVYQLVAAGALTSGMVPVLAGLVATGQDARARRVVTTLGLIVTVTVGVAALGAWIAAPLIVPAITPGFSGAQLDETIALTRIMLIGPVLLSAGSVATSWMNARDSFGGGALAPAVYNLGIIAGALLLAPQLGVAGAAWGVVAGSILFLLAAWGVALVRGALPARQVARDPEVGRAIGLMLPRTLGLASSQLALTVLVAVASGLGAGAVAALATAQILLQLPLGLIGIPLGIVLLPSLAREVAVGNLGAYRDLLVRGLRALLLAMSGIAAAGAVLAVPVVALLFPGTARDGSAELVGGTLRLFLLGLPAHALIAVLARACYARSDTWTPVTFAIVAVVIDITLGIALAGPLGVAGLALAVAIGAWVEAAGLALVLRARAGLPLAGILAPVPAILVASAATAATAWLLAGFLAGPDPDWLRLALATGLAGGAALLVHVAVAWLLRVPEVGIVLGIAWRRVPTRLRPRAGGAR